MGKWKLKFHQYEFLTTLIVIIWLLIFTTGNEARYPAGALQLHPQQSWTSPSNSFTSDAIAAFPDDETSSITAAAPDIAPGVIGHQISSPGNPPPPEEFLGIGGNTVHFSNILSISVITVWTHIRSYGTLYGLSLYTARSP